MARIRSVHPSLWTDENFVSLQVMARLFLIGMWNEADDYGLFEWKPTRLKMRLAPNDAIDAAAIMDELAAAGFLVRLDRDGKALGLVKNFRKFQRPKTPSSPLVPLDDAILSIIGIDKPADVPQSHRSPSPVPPQPSPDDGEKSPQMEDGGGRMEGEGEKFASLTQARVRADDFAELWSAYPHPPNASRKLAEAAWARVAGEAPERAALMRAVAGYRRWIEAETARRGGRSVPVCHAANWLSEQRWVSYLREDAPADPAVHAARLARIPAPWRPVAERLAAAHRLGWLAWDTIGDKAQLSEGAPWSIIFETAAALDHARACGALETLIGLFEAGGTPEVSMKRRALQVVAAPGAAAPDPLEIPAFLRRGAA